MKPTEIKLQFRKVGSKEMFNPEENKRIYKLHLTAKPGYLPIYILNVCTYEGARQFLVREATVNRLPNADAALSRQILRPKKLLNS
jgi:hypothetical protein